MPTTYTADIGDRICELVANGSTITAAAAECGLSPSVVGKWAGQFPAFGADLARARDIGVDVQAESLLSIADSEPDVQRARLKSDNLRWLLSKVASRKYGDKLELNVNETISVSSALDAARARLVRPIRDQLEQDDTQVIDLQGAIAPTSTDEQSVPSVEGSDDDDLLA